jgi:hypothetical protein
MGVVVGRHCPCALEASSRRDRASGAGIVRHVGATACGAQRSGDRSIRSHRRLGPDSKRVPDQAQDRGSPSRAGNSHPGTSCSHGPVRLGTERASAGARPEFHDSLGDPRGPSRAEGRDGADRHWHLRVTGAGALADRSIVSSMDRRGSALTEANSVGADRIGQHSGHSAGMSRRSHSLKWRCLSSFRAPARWVVVPGLRSSSPACPLRVCCELPPFLDQRPAPVVDLAR